MAKIIRQFGGDGFADYTALITALPTWGSSGPSSLNVKNVLGLTGEKWINNTDTGGGSGTWQFFGQTLAETTTAGQREGEASFLMYFDSVNTGAMAADQSIAQWRVGSSSNNWFELRTGLNTGSGSNNEIYIARNRNGTIETDVPTGFTIEDGSTFYVTMRGRGETDPGTGGNNGAYEVYINETLVHSESSLNWVGFAGIDDFSNATRLQLRSPSGTLMHWRSFTAWDGWSTAATVAPKSKVVYDHRADVVTKDAGWSAQGGAADDVEALDDNIDTTYLETAVASEEVKLEFTSDPVLSAYNSVDAFVHMRASKVTAAVNVIDIEVRDSATSTTVYGSDTHNLASVAPTREAIKIGIEFTTPQSVDDIELAVINGS